MKMMVVVKIELPHQAEKPNHIIIGVAKNNSEVRDMIEQSIASRENSQRLENWIHPTIECFIVDKREVGVYFNHETYQVWTKEKGFIKERV